MQKASKGSNNASANFASTATYTSATSKFEADHTRDSLTSANSNKNHGASTTNDDTSSNDAAPGVKDTRSSRNTNRPSFSNAATTGGSHPNAREPYLESSYTQAPTPAPEAYPGYYLYGYYPPDPSLGYPHRFSAMDHSSYTRTEDPTSADSNEDAFFRDMYPSPATMVAPVPMGVYYSMPVYQRQFCYPGPPSGVPMVGFPMAHAIPGAAPSPSSNAEHSPFGGQSPVSPHGTGPHSPNDATMLNPRSHVFHPAMPPNGDGMGPYLYQDPRYFSYAGAPHPMAPPMVSPPVPLPSGYPMPPYDWTAYADHGTNAPPRRGSGPHRRRKPSSHPRSSTSSSVATSGGPDSRDSVPEIIPPVASPDVHLEAAETLPAGSTSDSPSQGLSGATSVNQVHGTRSNFVMWCGNVPSDATLDELWTFFSAIPSSSSEAEASNTSGLSHGILSIFIISRSSCAFVNYESQEHLDQACTHFQGKQLRAKANCPRLVCRPRKLEDAEYAGVAAQRGKGVHANWYRQQRKLIQEVRDQATQDDTELVDDSDANSIRSFSSTNSSLLRQPLFAHRFFILKSRSRDALVTALKTHLWSTQPHNEPVLDQAFRNSEVVTLFFSENFSGQFFGYANMTSSPGSTQTVSDPVEDLLTSQSLDDTCHPSTMASSDEHTDKTHCASPTLSLCSSVSATPSVRAEHQLHVDLATSAKRHNQSLEDNSFSGDSPAMNKEPLMTDPENKDAPTSQSETSIHESRTLQVGHPFSLDWKITQPLPFSEIQNLRNPWRDNRLIKVSRDGTELEPNVGRQLMSVWEAYLAREK